MKKNILFIGVLFFSFCVSVTPVNATEVTDKLYMDIQIEKDGSLFIREIAVLTGEYSGRLRDIEYKGIRNQIFTGSYSDFGGSEIYNGSNITDLKVYDISNKNEIGFSSFDKKDNQYDEVQSANKGSSGVYTKSILSNGLSLKIFNPSSNKSAFYIEYRVKDVVVIHDDIAEIYWNLLGTTYVEDIRDFEARISLPGSDSDYRVWLHGLLYGQVSKVDDRTSKVKYNNLEANNAVSIRIMFNTKLVNNAIKKSNVLGREMILAYEQKKADEANQEREALYASMIITASDQILKAEKTLELSYYTSAMDLLSRLNTSEEKTNLLNRANIVRNKIEVELIKKVETNILLVKQKKTKESLFELKNSVSLLLEGAVKDNYKKNLAELTNMVEDYYQKILVITSTLFALVTGGIILLNIINRKKYLHNVATTFNLEYYRDFPAEYEPGVIEYLMKKKVSNVSFSATILELIRKKIIKLEIDPKNNKKYVFIKNNVISEENTTLTESENIVMNLLFVIISSNKNEVSLDQIKNYGSSQKKAQNFIEEYNKFLGAVSDSAKKENFFDNTPFLGNLSMILSLVLGILLSILAANFDHNVLMTIIILATVVGFIYPISSRYRTKYGQDHYIKWMAHKKFLLDFGRFQEREIPDITLWERYLVTATILGCADQVQKGMQLHLQTMEDTNCLPATMDIYRFHLIQHMINSNLTKVVSTAVNSSVSYSSSTIASANSNSSSGGGFGGGASGGGGFGGGGGGGGRF